MQAPDHSLPLIDPATRRLARRWVALGVVALGIAGMFAGLLANTKSDYFYTALVVHVDLSVLVWFLTMASLLFTLAAQGRGSSLVADVGFYSFALGTALIVLSAFTGGSAYMSNYIPVIHHPVFFLGLGLILSSMLCTIGSLYLPPRPSQPVHIVGIFQAAFIMLLAILCFVFSLCSLPSTLSGQVYYEYAFWGGGHVLQFVHVQLMLVTWAWLAYYSGLKLKLGAKSFIGIYIFGLIAALSSLRIYAYLPDTDAHRTAFTMLMRHANGLAPLVLGAFILYSLVVPAKAGTSFFDKLEKDQGTGLRRDEEIAVTMLPKICLLMSILLFAAGGMLGYRIAGSDVTTPAHYHGSIVGVTLAFMGLCYMMSPQLGWADVSRSFTARLQPILYGGGQLCWMAGMAFLGAHGVPRKTPGSADTMGSVAAFLKHGGDGLALIGGLLFVFIMLKAMFQKPSLSKT